jgi:hypothetical protein
MVVSSSFINSRRCRRDRNACFAAKRKFSRRADIQLLAMSCVRFADRPVRLRHEKINMAPRGGSNDLRRCHGSPVGLRLRRGKRVRQCELCYRQGRPEQQRGGRHRAGHGPGKCLEPCFPARCPHAGHAAFRPLAAAFGRWQIHRRHHWAARRRQPRPGRFARRRARPGVCHNRRIYLSFAEGDSTGANSTAVYRAELDLISRTLVGGTVIYQQLPKVASTAHFGSRLVFDTAGYLWVTLGERALVTERGFAQI